MSFVDALRRIYPDDMFKDFVWSKTNLDGHSKELFAWLSEAARIVAFHAEVGNNAHCYVGGFQALKNARQFLLWATTRLSLDGAPS